jgi:polyisoprenyl-phosphate glycosyltransferase
VPRAEPGQDTPPGRWYPPAEDSGAAWAHVSGWAQLHGTRRSLSCVIPARNDLPMLRALLPPLSDTLTECGHPWEVIVVDAASSDGTEQLLRPWCELPGFRLAALDDNPGRDGAIVTGLAAARGEAVILLDANMDYPLSLIGEMVQRWESGADTLYAARDAASGAIVLRVPGEGPEPREHSALAGLHQADDRRDLLLLDRRVVRALLR